jgi:hypothetical protein
MNNDSLVPVSETWPDTIRVECAILANVAVGPFALSDAGCSSLHAFLKSGNSSSTNWLTGPLCFLLCKSYAPAVAFEFSCPPVVIVYEQSAHPDMSRARPPKGVPLAACRNVHSLLRCSQDRYCMYTQCIHPFSMFLVGIMLS